MRGPAGRAGVRPISREGCVRFPGARRLAGFLQARASSPRRAAGQRSSPRAGSPRSHGTTTLGSYLRQAIRAGPRREFQSPIRGRGLRRATGVQTPIAVRAKLPAGRHAPLRGRPLCPRQTPCTRFHERMQPRVVPCASARRRRRGGNSQGGSGQDSVNPQGRWRLEGAGRHARPHRRRVRGRGPERPGVAPDMNIPVPPRSPGRGRGGAPVQMT